jgi:hypothetical protein
MKTYARIQDGLVAETLKTEGDITSMFNPALVWVDVSSRPDIAEGWQFDGTNFSPPPAPPPAAPATATIAEQRWLASSRQCFALDKWNLCRLIL